MVHGLDQWSEVSFTCVSTSFTDDCLFQKAERCKHFRINAKEQLSICHQLTQFCIHSKCAFVSSTGDFRWIEPDLALNSSDQVAVLDIWRNYLSEHTSGSVLAVWHGAPGTEVGLSPFPKLNSQRMWHLCWAWRKSRCFPERNGTRGTVSNPVHQCKGLRQSMGARRKGHRVRLSRHRLTERGAKWRGCTQKALDCKIGHRDDIWVTTKDRNGSSWKTK